MNFSVNRSAEFRADLKEQAGWYVEQGGFGLAERYLTAVTETLLGLARHPFSGHPRRFRAPELQSLRSVVVVRPFNIHVVFYRVEGETVQIVRVMHGARDLPRRLRQKPASS